MKCPFAAFAESNVIVPVRRGGASHPPPPPECLALPETLYDLEII